jgi:UDP-2-acetamido-2,6-beta-L-arabino-hexul-4-ose reductase
MVKRIVITGAAGLVGWHAHARLHAENCAAGFRGDIPPFDIQVLGHAAFDNDMELQSALSGADAVLHFAGINRASGEAVEFGNAAIAERLIKACQAVSAAPHIVYANSTHAASDTPYGRGKKSAADILATGSTCFTDMILPHIFGECAKPYYNNVTATLIDKLVKGEIPEVNPDGQVHLLHAGAAAQSAIDAVLHNTTGQVEPTPRTVSVPNLLAKLQMFHDSYTANIYPDLTDPFDVALFNTYRAATYPDGWPRPLKLNTDARGTLFEASKGGGGGQTFFSITYPGVTRGNHFHLNKVERFLVVQGKAAIRLRKVLTDEVWEFEVSGDAPAPVDMPTLHTHSIENISTEPLLTLFWTHDLFDPNNPDTFFDEVLRDG